MNRRAHRAMSRSRAALNRRELPCDRAPDLRLEPAVEPAPPPTSTPTEDERHAETAQYRVYLQAREGSKVLSVFYGGSDKRLRAFRLAQATGDRAIVIEHGQTVYDNEKPIW